MRVTKIDQQHNKFVLLEMRNILIRTKFALQPIVLWTNGLPFSC